MRDTMGLSTREHGCYLLLLMHYWTEKCLTDDIEELLIITRLEKESRSVLEKILSRYFQHEGSCFRQKRVEKELKRREQQSAAGSICSEAKAAAARRNARKGGRPKKKPNGKPREKPNEKPIENPSPQSQSQSHCPHDSNVFLVQDTTLGISNSLLMIVSSLACGSPSGIIPANLANTDHFRKVPVQAIRFPIFLYTITPFQSQLRRELINTLL